MFFLRDTEAIVRAFIRDRFAGDARKCFDFYAGEMNRMDEAAILAFLRDAGVGGAVYRALLATLALHKLDTNGDGGVDWDEFQAGFAPKELP